MDLRLKTFITSVASSLLFTAFNAQAATVYSPAFCEPSELSLTVENKTRDPQRAWTQVQSEQEILETVFEIPGLAKIKIRGDEFLDQKKGFSVKFLNQYALVVHATCADSVAMPLSPTTSPSVNHFIPGENRVIRLHLLNLFLSENQIRVSAVSKTGAVLEMKDVQLEKYYDTVSFKWTVPPGTSRVEVTGNNRVSSMLFFYQGNIWSGSPPVALQPAPLPFDESKTYFLVSTKDNRPEESFVIALNNPEMIATARTQITKPMMEKIVVARIQLGHGGFNRSFSSLDKSPYSWSVFEVDAFSDIGHISCDGSPDFTEERLAQRLEEGGRICFWRYRVVKELKASEVALGALKP